MIVLKSKKLQSSWPKCLQDDDDDDDDDDDMSDGGWQKK